MYEIYNTKRIKDFCIFFVENVVNTRKAVNDEKNTEMYKTVWYTDMCTVQKKIEEAENYGTYAGTGEAGKGSTADDG